MSQELLLERVRKLLALAGSSNVHEAAAAAARAQALISRHRLGELLAATEDVEPIVDGRDEPLDTARRVRDWRRVLAATLAEANGCVAYTVQRGADEALVVAGRTEDRAAVRALWDALVKRIEWLSASHGAGRSRKWHEAFRVGVVDAIGERLGGSEDEARADVEEAALVRVDPVLVARRAAMDSFVRAHFTSRKGRAIRVDLAAWRAGRAASGALPFVRSAAP